MIDESVLDSLRVFLVNKYTPEELCEMLGLTSEDIFDMFRDEIVEIDWSEYL